MSNSAIMWCIDNCRSYVYYDEAVEEMREISDELDALRAREQALMDALAKALAFVENYGFATAHDYDGDHECKDCRASYLSTQHYDGCIIGNLIAEARAALAAAGERAQTEVRKNVSR